MSEEWVNVTNRITELEAELAEMRQEHERMVDQLHETFGLYAEARDELADLRASSVVVRKKCETCGGSGEIATLGPEHTDPCPDCVRRGSPVFEPPNGLERGRERL